MELGGEFNKNDEAWCQYGGKCVTNEFGPVTLMEYVEDWDNVLSVRLPDYSEAASQGCDNPVDCTPTWIFDLGMFWIDGDNGCSSPGSSDACVTQPEADFMSSGGYYVTEKYDFVPVITVSRDDI